jgi:hypothetical protein
LNTYFIVAEYIVLSIRRLFQVVQFLISDSRANFICTAEIELPDKKSDIEQKFLFDAQLAKYVRPKKEIAVLNAFPVFLYEYLK